MSKIHLTRIAFILVIVFLFMTGYMAISESIEGALYGNITILVLFWTLSLRDKSILSKGGLAESNYYADYLLDNLRDVLFIGILCVSFYEAYSSNYYIATYYSSCAGVLIIFDRMW